MVEFSYKNEGCRMVVLRCIGPSNFFLERVLFPTDILTFMAPNDSRVEIWGNELYGPKLEAVSYTHLTLPTTHDV